MADWRCDSRLLAVGALLFALACGEEPPHGSASPGGGAAAGPGEAAAPLAFTGRARCGGCHPGERAAWTGSHHDLAMQEAGPQSVLGDFDGAELREGSRSIRFLRRGDAYQVHTDGADGVPADFPVRYTFGVAPLQQLLVALPDGRLQALTAAWDARPAAEGGQRWFSLRPDEDLPPGDVLHWTGAANRWNSMCAACHSTNVRRGFDLATRSWRTTWSEVDVGCEACHGPGSRHVAWAESGAPADGDPGLVRALASGDGAHWQMDASRGIARRVPALASRAELESCAPCHSRRSQLSEDVFDGAYLDAFVPALLEEGLYFPDGQIRDEVYVYGSFLQSRMYAAGVTCSDCHEPHALRLRGGEDVCSQCHLPARFATPAHHHHAPGSEGARCVACHMPTRTYMQVDVRRDHGFRVPRPDLSGPLGTPNACDACHAERGADWAAARIADWRGGAPLPRHFGETFAAARDGAPGAEVALAKLAADGGQPAIVRASALVRLARTGASELPAAVAGGAADPEPLVRLAAAQAGEALAPPQRLSALRGLLGDALRAVRSEAARELAEVPDAVLSASERSARARGLDEYRATQELALDEPGSHLNLALLHQARGELADAEREYRRALEVGDYFVPAYVNLADLLRATGRDAEAEPLLREALRLVPESAEVHQALGLWLVRQRHLEQALRELAAAARLAPERAHFAYVHGLALQSAGRDDDALAAWRAALRRHPHDAELLAALATHERDAGRLEEALRYARALEAARPGDPSAAALRAELEARVPR